MKLNVFVTLVALLAGDVSSTALPEDVGSKSQLTKRGPVQGPSPQVHSKRAQKDFKLNEKKNPKYEPDAPGDLIKAHAKYGKGVPPQMQQAIQSNRQLALKYRILAKGATGSASASVSPNYDTEYVIPVQVGTPGQTTNVILDTGSADFWTYYTGTSSSASSGHILYDPSKSSTSKLLAGATWDITYGDGTGAKGIVYTDKVAIGATSFNAQAVEVAVNVSSGISSDTFSQGILGMGQSGGNTVRPTQQKTFIDNVQSSLQLPLFTANLQKGMAGNYNFGYINQSEYNDFIKFVSIDKTSIYWKFTVNGYKVNGFNYRKANFGAIADTGTTLLLLPSTLAKYYYSKVKGATLDQYQGMYTFPCDAKLPDFYFGLGGYRGRVPGNYINYGRFSSTSCFGGIQSSDGIGFSIFGDILLKAQFVVFDLGSKKIGFANKNVTTS